MPNKPLQEIVVPTDRSAEQLQELILDEAAKLIADGKKKATVPQDVRSTFEANISNYLEKLGDKVDEKAFMFAARMRNFIEDLQTSDPVTLREHLNTTREMLSGKIPYQSDSILQMHYQLSACIHQFGQLKQQLTVINTEIDSINSNNSLDANQTARLKAQKTSIEAAYNKQLSYYKNLKNYLSKDSKALIEKLDTLIGKDFNEFEALMPQPADSFVSLNSELNNLLHEKLSRLSAKAPTPSFLVSCTKQVRDDIHFAIRLVENINNRIIKINEKVKQLNVFIANISKAGISLTRDSLATSIKIIGAINTGLKQLSVIVGKASEVVQSLTNKVVGPFLDSLQKNASEIHPDLGVAAGIFLAPAKLLNKAIGLLSGAVSLQSKLGKKLTHSVETANNTIKGLNTILSTVAATGVGLVKSGIKFMSSSVIPGLSHSVQTVANNSLILTNKAADGLINLDNKASQLVQNISPLANTPTFRPDSGAKGAYKFDHADPDMQFKALNAACEKHDVLLKVESHPNGSYAFSFTCDANTLSSLVTSVNQKLKEMHNLKKSAATQQTQAPQKERTEVELSDFPPNSLGNS